MKAIGIVEEVVVHPVGGMQLTEGFIREDGSHGFLGCLPGFCPSTGSSPEEVRSRLEKEAKAYYGDDVVVEVSCRWVV